MQATGSWDLGAQHHLVSVSFLLPSSKPKDSLSGLWLQDHSVPLHRPQRCWIQPECAHSADWPLQMQTLGGPWFKTEKKKVPKDFRMMSASVQGDDD